VSSVVVRHPAPIAIRVEGRRPGVHAAVAGLGVAVPERVVTAAETAEKLGVEESWVLARTGVHERRFAGPDDRLDALAALAGERALAAASVAAEDLDLVLVATSTSDELMPNAAPLVAHMLGATSAGAMDVGAACTGFMAALALASGQVEAGRARNVLVVGADMMSRLLDEDNRATAALFADGAAAALVAPAQNGGRIGPIHLGADGSASEAVLAEHEDRIIRMQGHDTFRAAVDCLAQATTGAVEEAGLSLGDIAAFAYHQANGRILSAVGERLGLDRDRVVNCLDRFGNTSAATVPMALAQAESEGLIEPGDNVVLCAFGSGFMWGAGVVTWE
jgi:3-oxoacyl-[acyl-carrier-protein] synthase III